MRRIVAIAALSTVACASIGAPPGGPQRDTPPVVESITPDSGAVNVRGRNVVFSFDVVVSDRVSGARDLESIFLISPRHAPTRVTWRRDRIEVQPRGGFLPNTAYSITMRPGIADLSGNVTRESRTVVFSTGPVIPPFAVHGRVFDWMAERAAANARVEVIRRPDSLPYVGMADSTGQFVVGPLGAGSYSVRAILDANRNDALDAGESWDSLSVVIEDTSPFLELLAAPRDTIGPRIQSVAQLDRVTLSAMFDRPLDPATPLSPASFSVVGADSTPLQVVSVQSRALADSLRRARDTVAQTDTLPRRVVVAPRDTGTAQPRPRPSRPPPPREVVIGLDTLAPLLPGAYRVTAIDVRGLLGATRTSDRVITVRPAADSLPAPGQRPVRP